MSITCVLVQISSSTLARVKEIPSLLELFERMGPWDEEPRIDDIYKLSSEQIDLLCEILPNPEQVVGDWSMHELTMLEYWKDVHPKDFNQFKYDILQTILEARNAPTLDIGRAWHIVSYIFTGNTSTKILPFLANKTESSLQVNPLMCGQQLDMREDVHYLDAIQVREITKALSNITEKTIRQNFEQGLSTGPEVYSFVWSEGSYEELLERCLEVQEFYKDAMDRESAMLISIV